MGRQVRMNRVAFARRSAAVRDDRRYYILAKEAETDSASNPQ
jgi:hypothetical protein